MIFAKADAAGRCGVKLVSPNSPLRGKPCGRPAKDRLASGEAVCGIHSPSSVKAKKALAKPRSRMAQIAELEARIMPLSQFSEEDRRRIEEAVAQPFPPPKWLYFGYPGATRPVAAIESREWLEWHRRRGKYPGIDRIPTPSALRLAAIECDGLVCRICGGGVSRSDVHVDHIKPVSWGGEDTLDNLQVTHSRCSLRKGGRVQ